MRKAILAVILVLMVLGSLGVGYYGGVGSRQTATTTSTQSVTTTTSTTVLETTTETLVATSTVEAALCDTQYSASIFRGTETNSSNLVFVTNSTAEVCVSILNGGGDFNATWTSAPFVEMLAQNGTWVQAVNLTVVVHPSVILVLPNSTGWYVFQIIPANGTRAIYYIGLPYPCWGGMTLAVGYSVSQLQATVLNIPGQMWFCPVFFGSSEVAGITNLMPTWTK